MLPGAEVDSGPLVLETLRDLGIRGCLGTQAASVWDMAPSGGVSGWSGRSKPRGVEPESSGEATRGFSASKGQLSPADVEFCRPDQSSLSATAFGVTFIFGT